MTYFIGLGLITLHDKRWNNLTLSDPKDERNQIISSNAWLDLKWVDYQLKWDRSKYGNLSKIRIPYK